MFGVGDKVKCIDASIDADKASEIAQDFQNWITKGEIYTVRGVTDNDGIVVAIWLEGVYNIPKYFKLLSRIQEPAFATWRFRMEEEAVVEEEEYAEEEEFIELL